MSSAGTHLVTIAKNAGLGIGGRIFFLGARFCTTILITRTIGPEQYGIFALAVTIITVIDALTLMGLEPAMVKFVAQYKAQNDIFHVKGTICLGLGICLFSSLVLVLVGLLAAELIANGVFHKSALTPVLRIMLLGVPFVSLTLIILSALQGAKLVKYRIFVQQVLMPIFRFVVVCVLLWLGYWITGIAWAWVLTSIFGFIWASIFLAKRIGFLFHEYAVPEKKKIFSFSLPLLFSQLFYQNINIIGIIIIGIFLPAAKTGIYTVAMRVIPFILIPLVAYNAIFSPIISDLFTKHNMEELKNIYKTGSRWVITITLPIFVLVIFFSKEIVTVFGPGFAESAQIMTLVLIAQMFNVSSGSTGIMLSMTGKTLYNLFNTGILCLLNIVLTLLFISRFGTIGVAYAYTISIILIQLLQMGQVWYLYKIHPYTLGHLKPILSCLASFVVIYFFKSALCTANHFVSIMVLAVLFLCSYGALLRAAGLSSDDRMVLEKIRQKIGRRRNALI